MAGVETNYGYYNTTLKNEVVRDPKNQLDQDAFLKLLVAQMSNQDPMSPTSDTEFIGQLAQFSSLEQMSKMSQAMMNSQAYNLIGKYVYAEYLPEGSSQYIGVLGPVDGTFTKSGITYVRINLPQLDAEGNEMFDDEGNMIFNKHEIPIADIKEVMNPELFDGSIELNAALLKRLNDIYKLLGGTDPEPEDDTITDGDDTDEEGDGSESINAASAASLAQQRLDQLMALINK